MNATHVKLETRRVYHSAGYGKHGKTKTEAQCPKCLVWSFILYEVRYCPKCGWDWTLDGGNG